MDEKTKIDGKTFDLGFDHDGNGYSLMVTGLEEMVDTIREFFGSDGRYEGGSVTLHIEPMEEREKA